MDKSINFKVIEMEQGSQEWHKWRKNGVTATDLSIIEGKNPFTTLLQLWEKKCGFRAEDVLNAAMEHGRTYEPQLRDYLCTLYNTVFLPLCVEGEKLHYRASLDGYAYHERILAEIKCPISEKILDRIRDTQEVPEYWLPQLNWQASIVRPSKALFAVYDHRVDDVYIVPFFIDPTSWPPIQRAADEFWTQVKYGTPPKASSRDYIEVEDKKLEALLDEYASLGQVEKEVSTQRKLLRTQIEEFGDGGNFCCSKYKITRILPRPSYDINKMRDAGLPVDNYLKISDSIGWYRITWSKQMGD